MNIDIDIKLFKKYEKIRQSGKYNMVMDWQQVMLEMKLNPHDKSDKQMYIDIIDNYDELANIAGL